MEKKEYKIKVLINKKIYLGSYESKTIGVEIEKIVKQNPKKEYEKLYSTANELIETKYSLIKEYTKKIVDEQNNKKENNTKKTIKSLINKL